MADTSVSPTLHYHIDTDMGVDDGLALLLASRLFGTAVTLSTVFGNVPVEVATRNALIFRALLGREACWTILAGAAQAQDGFTRDARHVHGEDGMGGATSRLDPALLGAPAASPCVYLADAPPPAASQVVLIGLGPATNLPRLVSWYGHAAVQRIVLMSGAYFDVGNITSAAEFNAHCDPDALRETLALGIATTIVPLDICRKVQLTRAAIQQYGSVCRNARGQLITESHMRYMDFYQSAESIDGCNPHDAITILAAMAPERFFAMQGQVAIDSAPGCRGQTTMTLGPSHITVLTGGWLKWVRDQIAKLLYEDAVS